MNVWKAKKERDRKEETIARTYDKVISSRTTLLIRIWLAAGSPRTINSDLWEFVRTYSGIVSTIKFSREMRGRYQGTQWWFRDLLATTCPSKRNRLEKRILRFLFRFATQTIRDRMRWDEGKENIPIDTATMEICRCRIWRENCLWKRVRSILEKASPQSQPEFSALLALLAGEMIPMDLFDRERWRCNASSLPRIILDLVFVYVEDWLTFSGKYVVFLYNLCVIILTLNHVWLHIYKSL